MAEKQRIRRTIKSVQRVKTWQLLILLLLVVFVAATFLRLNNIGMTERRAAVLTADEEGNEQIIIERLYDLQRYVSSHMNADLGRGVYLEKSYTRDIQKWQETYYGEQNPNGNIYQKAQEVCAPKFNRWSAAYVQCTTDELAKYPAAADPTSDTSKPRQEAYIYAYVSPMWSPDFAGWSVLLALFIILVIVVRLIGLGILKLLLRRHYHAL